MRAAYFVSPRKIALLEEPEPAPPGPGEVLVRIDRLGVCGSDIHYYLEGRIGDQVLTFPASLGHECAGTIVSVGLGVEDLCPGQHVAIDPAISCGQCDQCRRGRLHTCRRLRFLGAPGEAPGAAAELRLLPAENCYPVPANLSLEEAVLAEPLSIAFHAVRLGSIIPGMRVGVIGCGPIGLCVIGVLQMSGVAAIYASELLSPRRQIAQTMGCRRVFDPASEDVVQAILAEEPTGLDVVFECSGDPSVIDLAQLLLTPGGTLVIVGITPHPTLTFNVHRMRRAELTFRNVRRQVGCMPQALSALSNGLIPSRLLLTHRFPFEKINEAFELVASYQDGVIKAIVNISEA
ncbi:MAG: alcohol dehydrogenase catalytic domain-containing protein [Thermoguttaceae bacterium]|nr:alcohol dehydrogenase catalytic domain-containing protein [Thermoguttaceae bacterium]MDW8079535.1 alcohol dehydrogenase catalytic domain-containing protein [Thermoguttaceae bacterium]